MKDKEELIRMLRERESGIAHSYDEISRATGYERKQIGRVAKEIREGASDGELLAHGNAGRRPSTTASPEEYEYLRELKRPYPSITIAQFRDIFIEDVIQNPDKRDDVERYGLVARSKSWFRQLFEREGWESPAARQPLYGPGRERHPTRPPAPSRGELLQIDGTEDRWIAGERPWCMHLAVDDATTEVAGGWFMPEECARGYCRMMREVMVRHGKPLALYSDRSTIFRSSKNQAPSQFGAIMSDLGIRMIFAGSSEAKGRVERYNCTAQMRLPNDVVRFGIRSYDELNPWFNDFYAGYLNAKFSFAPADPRDSFVAMPVGFDYGSVLRGRYERVVRDGEVSYRTRRYLLVDGNGEVGAVRDGTKVNLYRDALTDELYVERYGKRYECVDRGERRKGCADAADSQKDVARLLREYRGQR